MTGGDSGIITTGPSLVVPALMALIISLDKTMMACINRTMVRSLFSSQVALDLTSFQVLIQREVEQVVRGLSDLLTSLYVMLDSWSRQETLVNHLVSLSKFSQLDFTNQRHDKPRHQGLPWPHQTLHSSPWAGGWSSV